MIQDPISFDFKVAEYHQEFVRNFFLYCGLEFDRDKLNEFSHKCDEYQDRLEAIDEND